jgi:tetratricopeptide (TPR) repeat protein
VGISTDIPNAKDLGARVRHLRQERRLSQREVAGPVISSSFLSLIESGHRQPSRAVLEHIADQLGVESEELLTGRSSARQAELELRLHEAREILRRDRVAEASDIATDVAAGARELGFPRLEAKAYELLASVDERRDAPEHALEQYRRAEEVWLKESAHLRFETVAGIARCHSLLGDPRYGIHLLESYLLELARDGVPDPSATMRTHSALVMCYSMAALPKRAAEAAESALELAPRVSDPEQIACMNANVARSLLDQGRVPDALDAIRRAEQAYMSMGWHIDAARARLNHGIVHLEKGELDEARENLTEALSVLRSSSLKVEAARALNELARVERQSGNVAIAESYLLEAQPLLQRADFLERGLNLREMGLCVQEKDAEEAIAQFRRAVDLYTLAGSARDVAVTYKLLGDVHRACGDIADGAEAYRAGIEAIESQKILD